MAIVAVLVSVLALRYLARHTPGREFMATFATVDVGMLVVLAVEQFSLAVRYSTSQRLVTVAARTLPLAFALLLALYGTTVGDHVSTHAARLVAARIFLGSVVGILSVVFSALDRAAAEPPKQGGSGDDGGNDESGPMTSDS
jgi:hypothetical protein